MINPLADASEWQKIHYERQLAELHDRLQEVAMSPPVESLQLHAHHIFFPM